MFDQISKFLKRIRRRCDDDFVDRLNYYYTSSLILIFAILVSAKQYVGSPIECWVPAQFTGAMEEYTENFCWVQNTWFLKLKDIIPNEIRRRENRQIVYYQWTPFILLIQSILSFSPCFLWRFMNSYTGYDLYRIVKVCIDTKTLSNKDAREISTSMIVQHIEDGISGSKSMNERRSLFGIVRTYYVTVLYIFTKLLYCITILLQFVLLNYLLGIKNPFFGWKLLMDLVEGREWHDSGIFPRVTLCDFEVKMMKNLHRYTVQCVLMINMFNEKIFMFLWFWFIFLLIMSILSLAGWTTVFIPKRRENFIKKYLAFSKHSFSDTDRSLVSRFALKYLGQDGFFALCLINSHGGCIITCQVISLLWSHYRDAAFFSREEFSDQKVVLEVDEPDEIEENLGFFETMPAEPISHSQNTAMDELGLTNRFTVENTVPKNGRHLLPTIFGTSTRSTGIARGSLRKEDRLTFGKHRKGFVTVRRMVR